VRVLLSGTLTTATLYSNNAGASQGNPFTADPSTGLFQFYADNGKYDITFSGGSPSITTPYTLSAILLLDNTTTNQPVVFAGSIVPSISVADDVGSAGFLWRTVYANALSLTGTATIGGSLLPATDATNLGSTTKSWNLFANNITWNANTAFTGALRHFNTGARIYTFPDFTGSVSLLNLAQNWTAPQTFLSGTALASSTFGTLTSASASPALSGTIRLANADTISFRNGTNSADIPALAIDGANLLVASGRPVEIGGTTGGFLFDQAGELSGPTNGTFKITSRALAGAPNNIFVAGADATVGNNNGGNVILSEQGGAASHPQGIRIGDWPRSPRPAPRSGYPALEPPLAARE
jgi:hypothetical protein